MTGSYKKNVQKAKAYSRRFLWKTRRGGCGGPPAGGTSEPSLQKDRGAEWKKREVRECIGTYYIGELCHDDISSHVRRRRKRGPCLRPRKKMA